MKLKASAALATMFALILALSGCAGSGDDGNSAGNVAVSFSDVATADIDSACQSAIGLSSDDGLVSILDAQADRDSRLIRVTFEAYTDDVRVSCDDADALCKEISALAAKAAYDSAAGSGDDDAAQAWMDVVDKEEKTEGLGALYATYSLVAVMDNSSGTLNLDGTRSAGADGGINWQ